MNSLYNSKRFVRIFMRSLAVLVASGIPLRQALQSLEKQQEKPWQRAIIHHITIQIQSGKSFAGALKSEPRCFSKLVVGLVAFGEETGTLSQSLSRVADFLDKNFKLELKLKSALTYPAFLMVLTFWGTLFLVKFVLPLFLPIFAEAHHTLPKATQLLIELSRSCSSIYFVCALLLLTLVFVILSIYLRHQVEARGKLHALLFEIPILGSILKKGFATQLTWTLATSYASGVSLMSSLTLLEESVNNERCKEFIQFSRFALARGELLSAVFLEEKTLLSPIVGHLMAIAETTGSLDRLMSKCAHVLEEELDYLLGQLTVFLEPIILSFMGCVIGLIMVSFFLPLYGMLGELT